MSDIIAEERTTLPEGAVVSVSRVNRPKLGPFTEIRAWRGNNIVKMRADDVTPQNLRWYLDNIVKEIARERVLLAVKPSMQIRSPNTIKEFVNNMAACNMFLFESTLTEPILQAEPEKPKKKRRSRKPKAVTVPANGTNPQ